MTKLIMREKRMRGGGSKWSVPVNVFFNSTGKNEFRGFANVEKKTQSDWDDGMLFSIFWTTV